MLTATAISVASGAVWSLLLSYIPGLNASFAGMKKEYQQLIMAGLVFATTGVVFGLNCAGWFSGYVPEIACTQQGLQDAVVAFILAVAANQGVYTLTPQTNKVKAAKAARQ